MLDTIIFCIQAIAPMALLILLGWVLGKLKILGNGFREQATALLFKVTLPVSMFTKVATADVAGDFSLPVVLAGLAGTFIMLGLGYLIIPRIESDISQSTVLIQGIYRSNFAVLGIPLASALFGSAGDVYAVSLLAVLAPLYSIIAVFVLTPAQITLDKPTESASFSRNILTIFKNPLVLSVLIGLPFSLFDINIFRLKGFCFLTTTMDYLSSMTLPLGMLCIGVSLATCCSSDALAQGHICRNTWVGVIGKLLVSPAITLGVAYLLGCRGVALGVLLVLVGGPCSVTSYVMASSMGGNKKLSANLVVYTTILSIITIVLGSALLMY